jgi:hypothetical protein
MARPSAELLLEHIDDNMRSYAVCASAGIYAVYYRGQPISLRMTPNIETPEYPNAKYPKTSFANPGHAFNLAERLNKRFNTDEFVVMLMNPVREIREL